MEIFFLCGQSFLSMWGLFFCVCVGGGVSFSAWGRGHYWACPNNNFCGILLLSHFLLRRYL